LAAGLGGGEREDMERREKEARSASFRAKAYKKGESFTSRSQKRDPAKRLSRWEERNVFSLLCEGTT